MKKIAINTVVAISVIVIAIFALGTLDVRANPSLFYDRLKSAQSTTTIAYLAPGSATTTSPILVADVSGPGRAIDSAALMIQLTGSSTNTVLGWKYEYSQGDVGLNCLTAPATCDWYSDDALISTTATSTYHVGTSAQHLWVFASSTIGTSTAASDRATKIVNVPTPAKYTRVIFFLPPASTRGAIWTQWVAKAENSQ